MGYRTILVCLNEVDRAAVLLQVAGDLAQKPRGTSDRPVCHSWIAHLSRHRDGDDTGPVRSPSRDVHGPLRGGQGAVRCAAAREGSVGGVAARRVGLAARRRYGHRARASVGPGGRQPEQSRKRRRRGIRLCRADRHGERPAGPAGPLLRPFRPLRAPGAHRLERDSRSGKGGVRCGAYPQARRLVYVSRIDAEESEEEAGPYPGAELAKALARHGIKTTAERLARSEVDAGEALLSHASDVGADLIVMGAYGHGRLREFILGGATRTILQAMTVPDPHVPLT
jgi:nucleotide-binding universal stress UspA family protein